MSDPKKRCAWVNLADPLMVEYHDREWGTPVHDDRKHFEFLILEGAQAGLSWSTVLHKREGYRRAFSDFDPEKVARYTDQRDRGADPGRVDHPESAEGGRRDQERAPIPRCPAGVRELRRLLLALRRWAAAAESLDADNYLPATSPQSDAFSKDLKSAASASSDRP